MTYRPYSAIIAAAQATSTKLSLNLYNNSGYSITALQPVAPVAGTGEIQPVDISNGSSSFRVLGLTSAAIPNGDYGDVVTHGRIQNISTPFSFGDFVYVAKDGTLTNVEPSYGTNGFTDGDYSIKVGMIVKNKDNPSQKDLIVNIEYGGAL
jgi:hypothetical protein